MAISISWNLVSGRSRGAPASPVQQQEAAMSAMAEAPRERKIRIMESGTKGCVIRLGRDPGSLMEGALMPGTGAASKESRT